MKILGIHHITAITADVQRNFAFCSELLGLRLVKITVNFDDPAQYHLYYGDSLGRPGTILTFFVWPNIKRGNIGSSQLIRTSLAVPLNALEFWKTRLREHRIDFESVAKNNSIQFSDPDGMQLELIEKEPLNSFTPWERATVPTKSAIYGIAGATLSTPRTERTVEFLFNSLGARMEPGRLNQFTFEGDPLRSVLSLEPCERSDNSLGAGSVHHIAFQVSDTDQQNAYTKALTESGVTVSPLMDRQYFHSLYFREPSGVLFELATIGPGFATDEPVSLLGRALKLPRWLEKDRSTIAAGLPKLKLEPGIILP